MPYCALMRYYQPFPAAIPLDGPGYPHVTHPSATKLRQDSLCTSTPLLSVAAPFDLHVLGTPPAFILSQDRTLDNNVIDRSTLSVLNSRFVFRVCCPSTVQRINLVPVLSGIGLVLQVCIAVQFSRCSASLLMHRRRRDLNSRAAINDLHPFQGCPFSHLGTSPNCLNQMIIFK